MLGVAFPGIGRTFSGRVEPFLGGTFLEWILREKEALPRYYGF